MKQKITIAFNVHKSDILPKDKASQEGGPMRFSSEFKKFFSKEKDFVLKPLVFSYEDTTVSMKMHTIKSIEFTEIICNKDLFQNLHKGLISRKLLPQILQEYVSLLTDYFIKNNVTVVFLNGFAITNWLLMYAAKSNNIPVVMQHAGIFIEDISAGGKKPATEVKKFFYSLEKETVDMVDHHVFLNNFSKTRFEELYKNAIGMKTSIIPIPINVPSNTTIKKSARNISIGIVARWDSIKNFSAVVRLAEAMPEHWSVHCITTIPETESDFAKTFKKKVIVEAPRPIKEVYQFFKKMDVVIFPSHFETFGGVAAESMAVGTPVVLSENTGASELFKKFKLNDHIISPAISGENFVLTIQRVLDAKDKNQKKYELFRTGLKKDFSPEKIFNSYKKLFVTYSKKR